MRAGNAAAIWFVSVASAIATTWWFMRPDGAPVPSQIDIPDVSDVVAAALRDDRYATLRTIGDVRALPGEFAENEALYAVAARADATAIQDLLYQALNVRDPLRRDAMVDILLLRLVDLDPRSAIAFADGPLRRTGRRYVPRVYGLWARRDFDTALTAAALASGSEGEIAAALYGSLPSLDDSRAADIESALGVAPSSQVVAEAVARAYAESRERAIAVLEARSPASADVYRRLAALLYAELGADALRYTQQLENQTSRAELERALLGQVAAFEPVVAIDRMLSNDRNMDPLLLADAFASLAREDVGEAMRLLDRVPDHYGHSVESRLLASTARNDVRLAVVLVDAMRHLSRDKALARIVSAAGHMQAGAALDASTLISRPEQAGFALTALARDVPAGAMPEIAARLAVLDIDNTRVATEFLVSFAAQWALKDSDAAVGWALSLPEPQRDVALQGIVRQLGNSDPQQAARLAAEIPGVVGEQARRRLIDQLVERGSVDDAMQLARSASGPEERLRLETSALKLLSRKDPERALMLVRQRGDRDLEDVVTAAIVEGGSDAPRLALDRARDISDPLIRNQAVTSLMARHAYDDLPAARALVESLDSPETRDPALVGLALAPSLSPDEALAFTERITDESLRQQAQLQLIWPLIERDPDQAVALFEQLDLPPMMRDQFELILRQRGIRR